MRYYRVAVAARQKLPESSLTYSSDKICKTGQVVSVKLRTKTVLGLVLEETSKPEYATKPIENISDIKLPKNTVTYYRELQKLYPHKSGSLLQNFIPSFVSKVQQEDPVVTKKPIKIESLPSLTADQTTALHKIDTSSKTVLQGVTGSGKTRVFMELAVEQLRNGKNVLIVVPEISLTPQLQKVFNEVFGSERVHSIHSSKTTVQRRKVWSRIYNKPKGIITLGTRSSLFLPHSNLGLIVVDEFHDQSIHQTTGSKYNGIVAASLLRGIHSAKILFSSATPPITETHQLTSTGASLVSMQTKAISSDHPINFSFVDISKPESYVKGSRTISKKLHQEITASLADKKQTLLFLNKKGSFGSVECDSCGWSHKCHNCSTNLTYHHDSYMMTCHMCGASSTVCTSCPDCNSSLKTKTPGIKHVEQELISLFPSAKIMRFDTDNKKEDSFHENYEKLISGEVDIFVGTQMITKGLDLPKLRTVGVLKADHLMHIPDYSTTERAFQLLTQVVGRVGRGHTDAEIVLQSWKPSNQIFNLVKSADWQTLYKTELQLRERYSFPPFTFAAKIWSLESNKDKALEKISALMKTIQDLNYIKVIGPVPSYYEKIQSKYSYQLILFSKSRSSLLNVVENIDNSLDFVLDPSDLL